MCPRAQTPSEKAYSVFVRIGIQPPQETLRILCEPTGPRPLDRRAQGTGCDVAQRTSSKGSFSMPLPREVSGGFTGGSRGKERLALKEGHEEPGDTVWDAH